MIRITDVRLPLEHDSESLKSAVRQKLSVCTADILDICIFRKAVDARRKTIYVSYTLDVSVRDESVLLQKFSDNRRISRTPDMEYRFPVCVKGKVSQRPVIIGAGPCGLFAGLILAQAGFEPVILERGKPLAERIRDVHNFWRNGILDVQSNALFGQGGAGTFSDGKLTTQITDKANRCRKVLMELVDCGAPPEILFLSKPHIGTDKLAGVINKLCEKIENSGGQISYQSHVRDLKAKNGRVQSVVLDNGTEIETQCVILAVGHSARDTFEVLQQKGAAMQNKAFSIGLRIEHSQDFINRRRYGSFSGHPALGAADYKLVHHCQNGRGVYSFCMCPGGEVIACSSQIGGVVTNGMSGSARNKPNANAAILVSVRLEDFAGSDALAGIAFQRKWEQKAFEIAGGNYNAPAQLACDFLAGKISAGFGSVQPSYTPAVVPCDLSRVLPGFAVESLREGLSAFDKKIKGFAGTDAVLTGVETRSSCPLRILRDENYCSINIAGLYPAGEGAGYSGGIMSSAVDGIKVAESVALRLA